MVKEIWKKIAYTKSSRKKKNLEISNFGNIRDGITKELKSDIKMFGRYLYSYGIREFIHRLVANTFVENPEGKTEVNHKDGNRENNCADNLEWVTRAENMKHASENNLINRDSILRKKQAPINARKGAEKTRKPIAIYSLSGILEEIVPYKRHCAGARRLTYKGKVYRYCEEMIELYGEIPAQIDPLPAWITSHKNNSKLLVARNEKKQIITIFDNFPNKKNKDKYYYSYIYKKPDKNGVYWDFIPRKDKI